MLQTGVKQPQMIPPGSDGALSQVRHCSWLQWTTCWNSSRVPVANL